MAICNLCGSSSIRTYATFEKYTLLKCSSCGLLFTDQDSVQSVPRELYTKEYFEGVHAQFFADCKVGYETRISHSKKLQNFQHIAKTLRTMKSSGTLLDIGCATGVFLDMAHKEGFSVVGVDLSQFACDYARENFGIDTHCGKLEDLHFPDKSVDVITMWDLIEHVPDPKKFLSEVRRILKDNGLVFVLTINDSSLMGWLANGVHVGSLKTISVFTRLIHPIHHNFHFKEKHLKQYLSDSGFAITWKEKSEMPVENIEGPAYLRTMARLLYVASETFGLQHEIWVIAGKQ